MTQPGLEWTRCMSLVCPSMTQGACEAAGQRLWGRIMVDQTIVDDLAHGYVQLLRLVILAVQVGVLGGELPPQAHPRFLPCQGLLSGWLCLPGLGGLGRCQH